MKEKIRKAMDRNNICSMDEAESAVDFVRDLLELIIEETQEKEPYATNTIHQYETAVSRMSDLLDELEGAK